MTSKDISNLRSKARAEKTKHRTDEEQLKHIFDESINENYLKDASVIAKDSTVHIVFMQTKRMKKI